MDEQPTIYTRSDLINAGLTGFWGSAVIYSVLTGALILALIAAGFTYYYYSKIYQEPEEYVQ